MGSGGTRALWPANLPLLPIFILYTFCFWFFVLVGVAVSYKLALESGADKKEIAEAIGVAKVVRKNANLQMDKFAAGLLDMQIAENTESACGCSGPQ